MPGRLCTLLMMGAALLPAAELPVGTTLSLRLKTKLDTTTNKAKDRVEAVVIAPVVDEAGKVLVASGVMMRGTVKEAVPSTAAKEGTARLVVDWTELRDAQGHTAKVSTRLVAVDNARELVNDTGAIVGIDPKTTYGNLMDRGIQKLSEKYGALGGLLSSVKGAIVERVNPEIQYDPGVEFRLALTKPVTWNGPANALRIPPVPDEAALAKLVNSQPFRTRAEQPPRPSDMTTLMFIGTEEQIVKAFTDAGWVRPVALSSESKWETARAIIESRGYKEGPMSTLLLDEKPPDLDFQKQNNTFAMRHHLRIWRRPGTYNDKPIWVCAATHDIAIAFSESDRTFIHKIDPEIDKERAKVVSDLLFTGTVQSLALVARTGIPKDATNATGDTLITDGRMAVILF